LFSWLLCIVLAVAAPALTARFQSADKLIDDAIAAGKCPGAVLLVGQNDSVVYRKAYGHRALEPIPIPQTEETIFDAASLTKPLATATSIMILADRGKLAVTDPVAKYIPEFGINGKENVTIEQLLLHIGGMVPDNDIADYADGPAQAWKNICSLQPRWTPGKHFAYSDVGFIVLGKVVEAVSGQPLDQFAKSEIYDPLDMSRTRFIPPAEWKRLCAPTEKRAGHWMVGEVHDPRAYALGKVAGHAGLFTTADDLSRFCRMLLHGGELEGHRILSEATMKIMLAPHKLPDNAGFRAYGFDSDTAYSGCRGDGFTRGVSFGHTGFTGTMFWVDPARHCYLILLTNSVHPRGAGNVKMLRHDVATVVAEAILEQH
jgi:CubicO group peptidase (beta-lactamase class C family)